MKNNHYVITNMNIGQEESSKIWPVIPSVAGLGGLAPLTTPPTNSW